MYPSFFQVQYVCSTVPYCINLKSLFFHRTFGYIQVHAVELSTVIKQINFTVTLDLINLSITLTTHVSYMRSVCFQRYSRITLSKINAYHSYSSPEKRTVTPPRILIISTTYHLFHSLLLWKWSIEMDESNRIIVIHAEILMHHGDI